MTDQKLTIICGFHNHKKADTLIGHAFVGRLTEQERTLVADMTKNDVKPQKIMLTVKDHNPGNLSTINTIYNERKKYRHFVKRPITEMQHLMN